MVNEPPQLHTVRNRLAVGCLTLLALLGCMGVGVFAIASIPADQRPAGFEVRACWNTSTAKGVTVSGWWMTPDVKGAPLWAYASASYPSCASFPWLPVLPKTGNLHWP